MILRAADKLKTNYYKNRFKKLSINIRNTEAIDNFDDSCAVVVLSMVQKKDIDMYLLALKSFLNYVKVRKVIVVADPSIDEADIRVLSEHIPNMEIKPAESFRNSSLPVGGTWERLYAISHYCSDDYTIQLDADTLTLSDPVEVIDAVKHGNPFVLGTHQGQSLSSLEQASKFAKSHIASKNPHVQLAAEAALTTVDLPFSHYVRGCSGFTGFPKGSVTPGDVEKLSSEFYKGLGDKWEEWGSEQFASNLLLSNLPGLVILPIKNYLTPQSSNFVGQSFLHLIGSMRFANDIYLRATRLVLEQLNKAQQT